MEKILIFIKHHLKIIWRFIEWINGLIFSVLFGNRLNLVLSVVLAEYSIEQVTCRRLTPSDAEELFKLINSQQKSDLEFFNAHGFDIESIKKQCRNMAFVMMGSFDKERMIGYFFLRFFANRKCFVGRLIDKEYRGKGIGLVMNYIMYETSWRMNFRCLSTISRNNSLVMKAHSRNNSMKILKELPRDYLLVEFVRQTKNNSVHK